jgi:glycerophosphoryl diester phosphodiesterase
MTAMSLGWLTARAIAHRGLHDDSGAVENTAPAFAAAIAHDYAIECDVQISSDGEVMVHHDDALGRLTEGNGRLAELSAAAIKQARFKQGGGRILDLGELCDLVGGRTPLIIELKSRFDGDLRLALRAAAVLSSYGGPAALMSFDPAPIAALRELAPGLTRGIVAERHYEDWPGLPPGLRRQLAYMTYWPQSRPHFIAYAVKDLPALPPLIARYVLHRPLLTWTVRSAAESRRALRWADQIIFEGWRP